MADEQQAITPAPTANVELDIDKHVPEDITMPRLTWKNRTKISWGCFWLNVAVLFTVIILPSEKLNVIKDVLSNILYADVFVIAAYFGTTTLPFLKLR